MTIDPKRVKEIFLEAAELPDAAARMAYLDRVCGDDGGLRGRVEALLLNHDPAGSFLGTPAAVVPDPDPAATQSLTGNPDPGGEAAQSATGENGSSDDESLSFLSPPTRPDSLGRIGHYEVLQVLGRGGFGIVFRVFDEMLQRVVALKVMAPQLAATSPARKRFLREARSSAQVRHENVVHVYEVAEQPLPYLAMEFIPGETLQQKLNRVGPLDVSEILRIGRQIAEGLAAAHATDLIHRDIKPGNVLLEGGHHKVKITDFGLARAADDASISQSGIIAGTPMYMAPEQAKGEKLDQRADLFSLGSVLYQMVAGRPPFRASSAVAVLKRVAEDTPRAIREIIPETPQWLCDIIAKLHAKDPDDRYQSAREVADVLADCESQLKTNAKLKDYSRIPRSKPQRSGRRKWVAAAMAVLLPVIALAVTEFAGVTHLFRGQEARNDETEGWVQLFNGKDLSGWKKHPIKPGFWRVDENGHLVGAGPVDKFAFLGTERDDFENFHLRVEAMVDTPESDSGVFFRVPFLEERGDFAEININPGNPGEQTGSLYVRKEGKDAWYPAATGLTKPKEWFILEIIARGDHVVTKVNGKLALDTEAPTPNRRGHIFLQQCGGKTIVRFRKIEIKELPATSAPLKYGDPEYTNTLGMKFKLIPAGKFTMGSSQEEIDRCLKQPGPYKGNLPTEGPEHPVEITQPFYLGATEVTVGQFRQFVDEEAYQVGDGRWRNPEFDQTDQHPVVFVSWNNAVDFCKWLSKREGKEYRLPTEAEWEYSCRAGKAGSRYGFGDDDAQLKDYAWFDQNSGGGTHPVGKKKPNAWGLYDMHGNAWEWCQDNSDPDYYKNSPVKDPPGGAGGGRVGRGGGWVHGPVLCRSAFRGYLGPDDHVGAGFRVLLVSPPAGVRTESGAKDKGPPQKQQPTHAPLKYGDPEYTNTLEMKFKLIPAGKFTMGSPKEEIDRCLKKGGEGAWEKKNLRSEGPEHPVEITRPFYLGATEVTIGQFRQFVEETKYDVGDGYGERLLKLSRQFDDYPVVYVTWYNAVAFCDWLSKKEGKEYRLPTEAEWEYSCRAGKAGSRYGFGDKDAQLEDYAWSGNNSGGGTHPVGKKKPNAWGLYDMHGNAWEWCQDNYDPDYYKNSPVKDPPGGAGGGRVSRGGSCKFGPVFCRSAFRGYLAPDEHRDTEGFRVLLVAPPGGVPIERGATAITLFTDADVQRIAALPAAQQIEEVRRELKRRNPGLDGIMEHKIEGGVVTELRIVSDKVADIAPIRVFDALRVLQCSATWTNDGPNGLLADLTLLKGMNLAALTHLNLANMKVGDAGMVYFKDCKKLTHLDLFYTQVSDAGLVHFKDCKNLTHLYLGRTKLSDAGLANFKDCKNLTDLWLNDAQVGDVGMVHFQDCKVLRKVNLAGSKVSDVGLAHFKDCKNLKYLYLDRTQVGDEGLTHFKGTLLRELNINNTGITDLTPLQGMPLEHICLTPKNITKGLDILRVMKSLETIGIAWRHAWPAAEFWQRYDKGEFK